MRIADTLRALRLQAMLARRLANWRAVWMAYRAGAEVPTLEFRSGARLYHQPGDAPVFLFLEIFGNRCYARNLPLPSSGTVVDIGANIGAFVLDVAMNKPALTVEAYEPGPAALETLARNVDANGLASRVRLYNEAVSAVDDDTRMWSGGMSLESTLIDPAKNGGAWIPVRTVSLATVVARAGRVALLKIDAEGAEGEILRDVAALAHVDGVIGEYHESLVPGVLADVRRALEQAGMEVRVSTSPRCGPMFAAQRARARLPAPRR
jgi:FkbM family methyltransferase